MSLGHGNKIVTDGLVFHYDMENTKKSWKGKPTINYAYQQNAMAEESYSKHLYTTDTTWLANHSEAIVCHNYQGGTLASYVNTGVNGGNWQVTHHAHWQLDPILNKPVVVMRDFDGQWKAKSWGLGISFNTMGIGYGDTYTISWLQWTDNIAKSAQVGLYGKNTSGTNNFHDGTSQAKGAAGFNTKTNTWQRVYATFTASTVWDLAASLSCYMYGHYNTRNTIKIADVQIETGNGSYCIENGLQTRSNTEALLDLTGNNTITANSMTYNSDGSFSFNSGSDNYVSISNHLNIDSLKGSSNITVESWVYYTAYNGGTESYSVITCWGSPWVWLVENPSNKIRFRITAGGADVNIADPDVHPLNEWIHVVGTYDGVTKKIYINGELKNSSAQTGVLGSPSSNPMIGTYQGANYSMNGKISNVKIYNKALTPKEVKQNFNAIRGRYGL